MKKNGIVQMILALVIHSRNQGQQYEGAALCVVSVGAGTYSRHDRRKSYRACFSTSLADFCRCLPAIGYRLSLWLRQ